MTYVNYIVIIKCIYKVCCNKVTKAVKDAYN